jgi:hypothetical protein
MGPAAPADPGQRVREDLKMARRIQTEQLKNAILSRDQLAGVSAGGRGTYADAKAHMDAQELVGDLASKLDGEIPVSAPPAGTVGYVWAWHYSDGDRYEYTPSKKPVTGLFPDRGGRKVLVAVFAVSAKESLIAFAKPRFHANPDCSDIVWEFLPLPAMVSWNVLYSSEDLDSAIKVAAR